ncbi:tRNA-(cytosine32)-2-thiocytidine synthetase TtcA [Olavius algarvensis associated proteobacterium Delta 3]|nr:tRNA-(cytosine32)-2-thiocytidine synthetase TtcA [Olavius algarvensis associated proteobacterium Delta 3]
MPGDFQLPRKDHTYKALNRAAGKALHRYGMLEDGDRVVVGVSGGKDSLTLLWLLSERLGRIPIQYRLFPVYIDPGFAPGPGNDIAAVVQKMGYSLRVEITDYGLRGHSPDNRENPCFLCSRLRRKRLFEIADELGCTKLALGHHKDDIIETLFLNMCYAGEVSTMHPMQPFFNGRFTVIRPLAYTDETLIRKWADEQGYPIFENPCPSARNSRRRFIKKMLQQLYRSNRNIKGNIFRALHHVNPEYLL